MPRKVFDADDDECEGNIDECEGNIDDYDAKDDDLAQQRNRQSSTIYQVNFYETNIKLLESLEVLIHVKKIPEKCLKIRLSPKSDLMLTTALYSPHQGTPKIL